MSMQDTVSDMLTRIKNAQARGHKSVLVPSSRLNKNIAKVLKEEGYISDYEEKVDGVKSQLAIALKYYRSKPVIEEIKRVSKPSIRAYGRVCDLPSVRAGMGIAIISTSKGVITDRKARELNCGGEVICIVA